MINRDKLFAAIRDLQIFNPIYQQHVDGINAILDACEREDVTDLEEIAYILATAQWETAHTMRPIREYGLGKGRKYGKPHKNGRTYYGRGFVQLTWYSNYAKLGKRLGLPLVEAPDLALTVDNAARILVVGMKEGLFSPAAGPLSKYLGAVENWLDARKVVNGTDKAPQIAEIARKYNKALHRAEEGEGVPEDFRSPKKLQPTFWSYLGRVLRLLFARLSK